MICLSVFLLPAYFFLFEKKIVVGDVAAYDIRRGKVFQLNENYCIKNDQDDDNNVINKNQTFYFCYIINIEKVKRKKKDIT